jgi:hypothetical protein
MDFDLSGQEAGKEVRLWIPYPVSDASQLITDVKVSGNYSQSAVYTDREYETPILFARWDKEAKSRKMTLSFHAERQEVVRKEFPHSEPSWDPTAFKKYLKATSLGPIDGEVKKLALDITGERKTVLGKNKSNLRLDLFQYLPRPQYSRMRNRRRKLFSRKSRRQMHRYFLPLHSTLPSCRYPCAGKFWTSTR